MVQIPPGMIKPIKLPEIWRAKSKDKSLGLLLKRLSVSNPPLGHSLDQHCAKHLCCPSLYYTFSNIWPNIHSFLSSLEWMPCILMLRILFWSTIAYCMIQNYVFIAMWLFFHVLSVLKTNLRQCTLWPCE